MKIQETKKHFLSTHIAGFAYHDGSSVFSELKIGTRLTLVREDENPYDPNAVALLYNDVLLGYIPQRENEMLAAFLDMGHAEIFEAKVQSLHPDAHPEHQVGVLVQIIRKK